MTAVIQRPGSTVHAIDGFRGFGGSFEGIRAAGATIRCAANQCLASLWGRLAR